MKNNKRIVGFLISAIVVIVIALLVSNPGFFPFLSDVLAPLVASSTPMPTYTTLPPLPTYTELPALPTHTAYPTYTPLPTATPTSTPTQTATSTPTNLPTNTPTDTATFTSTPTSAPTATPTSTPTNTPIPPRIILSGIQPLGNLIAVEMDLAFVEIEVRDPAPLGCIYTAQHVARGVIEAGVDLTAIDEDSIQRGFLGNLEKVKIPSPTISSCRIEFFRQYDRRGGGTASCFGNNWDAMSDIGRHLAMQEFVDYALQKGDYEAQEDGQNARGDNILERAERQARIVLRSFISEITGSRVEIEFEDSPEDPIIPPSCQIDPPANWVQHDEDNKRDWRRTK